MGITVTNIGSTIHHQHFHDHREAGVATQGQWQVLLLSRLNDMEGAIKAAVAEQKNASVQRELLEHLEALRQEIAKPKPDGGNVERALSGLGSIGSLVSAVQPLRELLTKFMG